MKEENLIFIVSQPRAGSTYLQNLLSNNEEVNTCSEPWVLLNFANQIKPSLLEAKFDNGLTTDAFNEYINKYPNLDFEDKYKQFLLSLYEPMQEGHRFVIDKTPRYWEILDELVKWFPKSKIIILKRNPVDVVKSMIKTWSIPNLEKLTVFKRDLLLAPKSINGFLKTHKENKSIYSLRYEDLISDTGSEISKLYSWIGITYSDAVLNTSTNIKYKGKYGDPFQNSEKEFSSEKRKASNKELKKEFEQFLIGYKNFLGNTFLDEYGNYSTSNEELTNTKHFSYFIHLGYRPQKTYHFKNEIKYFLKELYFRASI